MNVNDLIAALTAAVAKDESVGALEVIHFDKLDVERSVDSVQPSRRNFLLMNDTGDDIGDVPDAALLRNSAKEYKVWFVNSDCLENYLNDPKVFDGYNGTDGWRVFAITPCNDACVRVILERDR